MKNLRTAVSFCAILLSASAWADIDLYSGTLSPTGPRYNRPVPNGNLPPVTVAANAVGYHVMPFFVTSAGELDAAVIDALPVFPPTSAFDPVFILYQGGFDPSNPLTNALIGNDDSLNRGPGGIWPEILTDIVPLTQYYLITAGFDLPTGFGDFVVELEHPGTIALGLIANATPSVSVGRVQNRQRRVIIRGTVTGQLGANSVQYRIIGERRQRQANLQILDDTNGQWTVRFPKRGKTVSRVNIRATNLLGQVSVAQRIRLR